jgi:hypothetical protein
MYAPLFVIATISSLYSFGQKPTIDTVLLNTITINDSINIPYDKIELSDSTQPWEQLVLVLPIKNGTKHPIILTRISTGSGGMVPITSASQSKPILMNEETLIYYKYLRKGDWVHKTINFTCAYTNTKGEFNSLIINRSIIKKRIED